MVGSSSPSETLKFRTPRWSGSPRAIAHPECRRRCRRRPVRRCGSSAIHGPTSERVNIDGGGCTVPVRNGAQMANGLARARPSQRSAKAAIWALSRATPRSPDFPPFASSPRPSVASCSSANRRLASSDMTPDVGPRGDVGACNISCQRVRAFGGANIVGNTDDVCLQQSSDLFARLGRPVRCLDQHDRSPYRHPR